MKCNLTDEAIRTIIGNAPEGAEYWTEGYDVQYRKLVLDCVFGWFPDDKKWVRAIDNDIAMERVDKGFWLRNLVEELVDRQSKPIPQTKELGTEVTGWVNGDKCIYEGNLYDYQCVASWDENSCILSGASPESKPFTDAWIDELSKPESPEAKKEREELEAVKDAMSTIDAEIGDRSDVEGVVFRMIKAGYRVEK